MGYLIAFPFSFFFPLYFLYFFFLCLLFDIASTKGKRWQLRFVLEKGLGPCLAIKLLVGLYASIHFRTHFSRATWYFSNTAWPIFLCSSTELLFSGLDRSWRREYRDGLFPHGNELLLIYIVAVYYTRYFFTRNGLTPTLFFMAF